MAQDQTYIINRALTELVTSRVMSIGDQAKGARTMNAIYAGVRDGAQASQNWLFAKQQFQPAKDATAPLHTYAFSYTIPEACLRLIEIKDIFVGSPSLGARYIGESDKLFERFADKIYTNFDAPLNCSGVFRNEVEATWDPLFINYFVQCLAEAGFNELTRKGVSNAQWQNAKKKEALQIARRCNAIQEPPEEIPDDSWIMSRVGP